jgi:far upstream element-binding protein
MENMGMMEPSMGGGHMGHPGLGMMTTEDYSVPDRMVGLSEYLISKTPVAVLFIASITVIGKGGEQIATIQSDTQCKVQFAPDSGGMPNRPCQLMGTPEAIAEAKKTIERIIQKGQGLPDTFAGDQTMLEVFIPGNKVGLVIGKGGETIKQLQEQAGVKMVMIQDSNQQTSQEKPLRITGSVGACQKAKELVMDLIAEKDMVSIILSPYISIFKHSKSKMILARVKRLKGL